MRIVASVTFVALLSATTVPALADQFEWGPLKIEGSQTEPLDVNSKFYDGREYAPEWRGFENGHWCHCLPPDRPIRVHRPLA